MWEELLLVVEEDGGRRKMPSRKGMAESAGRIKRRRRKEVLRCRFSVARVVMRVSCSVLLDVSVRILGGREGWAKAREGKGGVTDLAHRELRLCHRRQRGNGMCGGDGRPWCIRLWTEGWCCLNCLTTASWKCDEAEGGQAQ
jgi:hypothetical protein